MRAIKLKDIVGAKIDDAAILKTVAVKIGLPVAMRDEILSAYIKYAKRRSSNRIVPITLAAAWANVFSDLYVGRAQANGLAWIDKIATTPEYGYCPMCGSETHKTVDHVLPRSPWAEFAFLSHNLVPSCGTCNTKRGNRANAPNTKPRLLHPYFDGALLTKRLHLTKICEPYDAPEFEPTVCRGLKPSEEDRVRHHLRHSVDLVVYQQYCSNRWSELQMRAKRCNTQQLLRSTLKTLLSDAKATSGPNSWLTAFYAGIQRTPKISPWLFSHRKEF